jgi:hypothetical protein
LAKPYNDAVLAMLPTTPLRSGAAGAASAPHESINDLPVHPATRQQLFYPTSESRQFTREDAAKAFSSKLLPAEKRIPHPQLVQLERWNVEEVSRALPSWKTRRWPLLTRKHESKRSGPNAHRELWKAVAGTSSSKTSAPRLLASMAAVARESDTVTVCRTPTGREAKSRYPPAWSDAHHHAFVL